MSCAVLALLRVYRAVLYEWLEIYLALMYTGPYVDRYYSHTFLSAIVRTGCRFKSP